MDLSHSPAAPAPLIALVRLSSDDLCHGFVADRICYVRTLVTSDGRTATLVVDMPDAPAFDPAHFRAALARMQNLTVLVAITGVVDGTIRATLVQGPGINKHTDVSLALVIMTVERYQALMGAVL